MRTIAGEFSVRKTSAGEFLPSSLSWLLISRSSPLRSVTLIPVSLVKASTHAPVRFSCCALYTTMPSPDAPAVEPPLAVPLGAPLHAESASSVAVAAARAVAGLMPNFMGAFQGFRLGPEWLGVALPFVHSSPTSREERQRDRQGNPYCNNNMLLLRNSGHTEVDCYKREPWR
ncbi:hypothetical protein AHiyo8_36470 [Arthrobacter sp. Hiyo8]|nr:hypothetical protein AHiyo8_36470 [Arthrobacter sp. Hiyo8]